VLRRPQVRRLRPARRAKNITLTTAARHFNVLPARIKELELGNDAETTAWRPLTAPG